MSVFERITWEEAAAMTWPEFRDHILGEDCLQAVNIVWWKEQWEMAKAISKEQPNRENQP